MEKFLTISEAAKLLDVNPETLRRWDKTGKFESVRHPINNYRVYPESKVMSLVEDLQLEIEYAVKEKTTNQAFFTTPFGKLYNLDVLDFFNTMEDASVDLIFADPPYNIKKAQWDTFSNQKEYVEWSMRWIRQAQRVLKHSGSLFICGFSEILADLKWSAAPLFKGCKWLVWYYRNKANLGNDWGRSHESILHFRKSKEFHFDIDAVRIPYNAHTLKYPRRSQAESSQYANSKTKKDYIWEPNPLGAKPKDVFEIPTISNASWEKYPHETQKPVELLRRIILSSSSKGDLVVDPFGGSGTTFAVAEAYKRQWRGNDLEEKYCSIIKERLSDKSHIERIKLAKDATTGTKRRLTLR